MMPPDIMFFLQQQRRLEMQQQAEQAHLLRAVKRTPNGGEWAFLPAPHLVDWARTAVLGMCPATGWTSNERD